MRSTQHLCLRRRALEITSTMRPSRRRPYHRMGGCQTALRSIKVLSANYEIINGEVHFVDLRPLYPSRVPDANLTEEFHADASSFVALNPGGLMEGLAESGIYGADKDQVFFQYLPMQQWADPKTFIIVNAEMALSKDQDHVFIRDYAFKELDPATLKFLGHAEGTGTFYLESKEKLYSFAEGLYRLYDLPSGDPPSFEIMGTTLQDFAKDKYNVYCNGQILSGADPVTFSVGADGLGHDGNHVYNGRCEIMTATD
jgi:DKNYY family